MKSVLADLIFLLQFSVAPPHLGGISVISELTVKFIWRSNAHVPYFELTTRLALRCHKG